MTGLEVFTRDDWSLRTVTVDSEPWFVAADVCAALAIGNPRQAVSYLDADEVRQQPVTTNDGSGRVLATNVVSEPGLYSLILRSRKPEAKAFKRWVTHEVLPAIRKAGAYVDVDRITRRDLAVMLLEAEDAREAAEARAKALEPSAAAWDRMAEDATTDFPVREAAQMLSRDPDISIGQNRLFSAMREHGWIDRRNTPYQNQVDAGRLVLRTYEYTDRAGEEQIGSQVRVTLKGLRDLHRLLGGTHPLALNTQLRLIEGTAS